jgi:hypothetical protein
MLRLLIFSFFCFASAACVTESNSKSKLEILPTHQGGIYVEYNQYDGDGNIITDNKNAVRFYSQTDGYETYVDTTLGVSFSQCVGVSIEKDVPMNKYERTTVATFELSEAAKNKIMNISIANQNVNWILIVDGNRISSHYFMGILASPTMQFPIYEKSNITFVSQYFQKK